MDRFHLMSIFVAVAEARGFAGAGRKLGLSPPAVTRAITALEGRLGVPLLTRTTRVVRLTDAGARYVDDCRRILAEVDEADAAVSGTHASARGHLVITAPVLFGRLCVLPLVTEYLRRHADVSASCWFVDRVVHMVDEGVDVAVRLGPLPDSSLTARKVGNVRHVVCASPQYLAAFGTPLHPRDLAAHTVISATAVTAVPRWRFGGEEGGCVVKPLPRLTTTTNDAAIAAAAEGFGLTRLLSYQVAPLVSAGALRLVLEAFEPAPIPVHVVHREGRRASKKVRAFVDLAIERLSADPAIH